MLVVRYDGRDISGWVMSEKYDGVRGFWDGKRFISKSGKIMAAPKDFTSGLPPFAIDGELWAGRGKFEKTTSIVARAKDWSELKFMVFDVPGAKGDLFARLAVLSEFLASHPNPRIAIIAQKPVISNLNMQKFLTSVVNAGGEGIVVRDPAAPYASGRSDKIMKIKPFKDAECRIVALNEGKGKFANALGSVICEDLTSGERFKIGSGFSEKEREMGFLRLGQIITYKYQNITRTGKPRFPVFLRVRSDSGL